MQAERNTVQKKLVYDALVRLNNHPTAEEIFREAERTHRQLSRGTVYRILNRMAEQRSVLRVAVPNGADHFDATVHPHHHFRCGRCGRVYDISGLSSEDIRIQVPDTEAYRITGYTILFEGVCKACDETR